VISTHFTESFLEMADSLAHALGDQALRNQFRDYLCRHFCEESLDFWLAAHDYERSPSVAAARSIYDQYVAPGAPSEINVSHRTNQKICKSIEFPGQAAPELIFAAAKREIFALLSTDSFARFKAEQAKAPVAPTSTLISLKQRFRRSVTGSKDKRVRDMLAGSGLKLFWAAHADEQKQPAQGLGSADNSGAKADSQQQQLVKQLLDEERARGHINQEEHAQLMQRMSAPALALDVEGTSERAKPARQHRIGKYPTVEDAIVESESSQSSPPSRRSRSLVPAANDALGADAWAGAYAPYLRTNSPLPVRQGHNSTGFGECRSSPIFDVDTDTRMSSTLLRQDVFEPRSGLAQDAFQPQIWQAAGEDRSTGSDHPQSRRSRSALAPGVQAGESLRFSFG
jgi:hypothetical protein